MQLIPQRLGATAIGCAAGVFFSVLAPAQPTSACRLSETPIRLGPCSGATAVSGSRSSKERPTACSKVDPPT